VTGDYVRFAPGAARLSMSDRAQSACEIAHLISGDMPKATL